MINTKKMEIKVGLLFSNNITGLRKGIFEVNKVFRISQKTHNKKFDHYELDAIQKQISGDFVKATGEFIEELGVYFIYLIFGISPKPFKEHIEFDGIKLPEDDKNAHHIEFIELDELRHFSGFISDPIINILPDSSEESISNQINMEYSCEHINHFNPGFLMSFEFNYPIDMSPWTVIEHSNRTIEGEVYGIGKDEDIPLWLEYIITSWSLYEDNNEKLAFFTAFAAFDKIIELNYRSLSAFYSTEEKKTKSKEKKEYCHKLYEKYSDVNRRIIEEKFHDIMKECGAINNKKYSQILKKLDKFEKIRNDVAHCLKNYENGQYIDLLLTIIRAMYLLKYNEDIDCIFDIKEIVKP